MITTRGPITLREHQIDALSRLRNGSILRAGVGSGKTFTSIFWAMQEADDNTPIVVITTAKVRNDGDFHKSLDLCGCKNYTVDSWNNIEKYKDIKNAVFIFDEQRIRSFGSWSRYFLRISKYNRWILCSATPGDKYVSYLAVFMAHGFVRGVTDFYNKFVIQNPHVPYRNIKEYRGEHVMDAWIQKITVVVEDTRHTTRHMSYHQHDYDIAKYKWYLKERFNDEKDWPIESTGELSYLLRKTSSNSSARLKAVREKCASLDRVIVFYNFNYELEALVEELDGLPHEIMQQNGKRHDKLPTDPEAKWIYLVQYNASEGWNCITTNHMIFYSLNYSWWVMEQAMGRIDRLNTPYKDLYYYAYYANSPIEKQIQKAIAAGRDFNTKQFERTL